MPGGSVSAKMPALEATSTKTGDSSGAQCVDSIPREGWGPGCGEAHYGDGTWGKRPGAARPACRLGSVSPLSATSASHSLGLPLCKMGRTAPAQTLPQAATSKEPGQGRERA